jgi:hypothetical protein
VNERLDYWTIEDFLNNENSHYYWGSLLFAGFFQMYKLNFLNKTPLYLYNDSYNCSECDISFSNFFNKKINDKH